MYITPKTINLLEENIRKNIGDIGLDKDFLDMIPKAYPIKEQIDKLGIIKNKHFFSLKVSGKIIQR